MIGCAVCFECVMYLFWLSVSFPGGSGYDQFSRLLTASNQQLLDIVVAEKRELVVQLASLSPDQVKDS